MINTSPRTSFLDRVLLLSVFGLVAVYSFRRMSDSDLWGHLACGKYLFTRGEILRTHYFNSSWPELPYLNHEWLFQTVIYGIQLLAGEPGLIALQVLLVLIAFFIVFRTMRLHTGNAAVLAFILLLGIMAASHRLALRPQHFSYVFLAFFLHSLHHYQQGRVRFLYALPLLMALWVNIHAESLWGLLVPSVFLCVGLVWPARGSRPPLKPVVIILALVAAASVLNPFGWKTVLWPLFVMKEQFGGVEELLPPTAGRYVFFWIYFGIVLLTTAARIRRADPAWVALSAVFGVIAWTANRGIPHFVLVSAPLLAMNLEDLLNRFSLEAGAAKWASRGARAVLLTGVLFVIFSIVTDPRYLKKYDSIPYPDDALAFLKKHKITGNMFNDHLWGGYLTWTAWPDLKPFIDGRMFHKRIYDVFYPIMSGGPGWEQALDRYGITIALLRYSAEGERRLNDALFAHDAWRLVYWDDISLLYVKTVPGTAAVVKDFGNRVVNPDRQFLTEYEGWTEAEVTTARAAAERNLMSAGSSSRALILAGNAQFRLGDFSGALARFEEGLRRMETPNAWIFYKIALCLNELGDRDRAAVFVEKCLALAPDFEEGHRMLSSLRQMMPGGIPRKQ